MLKAARFRQNGEGLQVARQINNFGKLHRELLAELDRSGLMTYSGRDQFHSLSQSGFEARGLSSPIRRGWRGRRCLGRFALLIIHDEPRTALAGQE